MNHQTITKCLAVFTTALILAACTGSNSPTRAPTSALTSVITFSTTASSNAAPTNAPTVNATVATGGNALKMALDKLVKAPGFHFVYSKNTIQLEGDVAGVNGSMQFTGTDSDTSPTSMNGGWIVIKGSPDDTIYHKVSTQWVKLDKNSADTNIKMQYVNARIYSTALALVINTNQNAVTTQASAFHNNGTETITGISADHYAKTDSSAASELGGGGKSTTDIWVSKSTNDVVKIVSSVTAGNTPPVTATFEFSKIGTLVTITAPQ